MPNPNEQVCVALALIVVASGLAGCVETLPIKHDELSKLSGEDVEDRKPPTTVETTDGETHEVTNFQGVSVSVTGGETYDFDEPLSVTTDGDTITLEGITADPGLKAFARDDIEQIELRYLDRGKTGAGVAVGGVAFGVFTLYIVHSVLSAF